MKKIAQFTLNVPDKLNNFGLTNSGYYFITAPTRITEIDVQAPAGTKIKLNNIFNQIDSDYMIVGSSGLFNLDLNNYYTQITKIYFDFNFNTQTEPVIVNIAYEYIENKLQTTVEENNDNDEASGSLMEYFNQVEIKLTEQVNKFEGKINASNKNIQLNADEINQLKSGQNELENQSKAQFEELSTAVGGLEDTIDDLADATQTSFEEQEEKNKTYDSKLETLENNHEEFLERIESIENTSVVQKYYNYGHENDFVLIDDLPDGSHTFGASGRSKLKLTADDTQEEVFPSNCASGFIILEVYSDGEIKLLTLLDSNNNKWSGIRDKNNNSLKWQQFQYVENAMRIYKYNSCPDDQINTIELKNLQEGIHIFCEDGRKRLKVYSDTSGQGKYYNLPASLLSSLEGLQDGSSETFPSIIAIEIFREYAGSGGYNIYKITSWTKTWVGYSQYNNHPLTWYAQALTQDV